MDAFPSSFHVAPIAFSDADGDIMELLCIWHSAPDNDLRIIAAGNDPDDSSETNEQMLSTCAYKRVEDTLARQEQDQLMVTLPDSLTNVSLRRDALSVDALSAGPGMCDLLWLPVQGALLWPVPQS